VESGDEAIDHGSGYQLEVGDAGEDGGVEETLEHRGARVKSFLWN